MTTRTPQETPVMLTDSDLKVIGFRCRLGGPNPNPDVIRLLAMVEQTRRERDRWEQIATVTGGVERLERFWSLVDKTDECWLWTGRTDSGGYGQTSWNGQSKRAHRVAYELSVGPIPEDRQLDHLCRNPPCVNPDHLEPVTHQENMRRGLHGELTTHCPAGHPYDDDANTYRPAGTAQRRCRACLREHRARFRERQEIAELSKHQRTLLADLGTHESGLIYVRSHSLLDRSVQALVRRGLVEAAEVSYMGHPGWSLTAAGKAWLDGRAVPGAEEDQ